MDLHSVFIPDPVLGGKTEEKRQHKKCREIVNNCKFYFKNVIINGSRKPLDGADRGRGQSQ